MIDAPIKLRVGDRIRYAEGTMSSIVRKGEAGVITAIFSDGTSGPQRADVMFEDGLERGVSLALFNLA
jgi:hypothetical protein